MIEKSDDAIFQGMKLKAYIPRNETQSKINCFEKVGFTVNHT